VRAFRPHQRSAADLLPMTSPARPLRPMTAAIAAISAAWLAWGAPAHASVGSFPFEVAPPQIIPQPDPPAPDATPMDVRAGDAGLVLVKPLRSMRALRTEGMFLQQTDFSCGAAALATVLREHYGFDVDEASVIAGMLPFSDIETVRRAGFSLLDMRKFVESIGLRGRGFKVGIERLFDLKVPAITLIERDGYKHFVVIKRAAQGRVFVADPSYGHRTIRIEDFAEQWSGVLLAVTGPNVNPNSVLQRGFESPALTHRADAARVEIQRSALDYGFRSLDMF
jgi:predicted double-glycine peptidase